MDLVLREMLSKVDSLLTVNALKDKASFSEVGETFGSW